MDAPTSEQLLLEENVRLRRELDALRQQARTFQAALDHAPLLISAKDLQGRVTMANRHFDVLDGYDPATFVGANVFDLFPPEIAEQLWRNDRRAALERRAISEERGKSMQRWRRARLPLTRQPAHRHGHLVERRCIPAAWRHAGQGCAVWTGGPGAVPGQA